MAVMLQAIEETTPQTAESVPKSGTFYSAQFPNWPPLPCNINNVPVWNLGGGVFLLSDLDVNYSQRPMTSSMMTGNMLAMDVPVPGDGGDSGTNSYTANESSFVLPDYGTNLWISQVGISSGSLVGVVSNSQADISYEIQSLTDLTQAGTGWGSEGFILGSELTNWTPMSVAQGNRPNLFLRVKSWADTQDVGIPDWWQLFYFHEIGIDPNADPDGDGLSNIQEYLNGTDPTVFNLPDAPSNFIAVLSTNGTNVLLSWDPSPQLVPNYTTLGRYDFNWNTYNWDFTSLGSVNSNATSFVDVGAVNGGDYFDSYYQIQVVYARGSTPIVTSWIYLSSPIPPTFAYNIPITALLVRNSTGRWQLMCSGVPVEVQTMQLTWTDSNGNSVLQNISISSLTNGTYYISDTDAVNHMGDSLSVQLIGLNGEPGQFAQAGFLPNDAPYFVDGCRHMKQNLSFLIRGACPDLPYMGVNWPILWSGSYNQNSTNFEEFSFLHHGCWNGCVENMSQFQLDNLWPFSQNYHLSGFILNTSTYTNVYPQSDITPAFVFQPDFATNIPTPAVLDGANPYWIIQPEFLWLNLTGPPNDPSLVGVDVPDAGLYTGYNTTVTLPSDTYNVFGLPYQTGCLIKENWWTSRTNIPTFATLAPGDTDTLSPSEQSNHWFWGGYASQCPAPTLQFVNYYFAPLINPNANTMSLPGAIDYSGNNVVQYPTPLDDTFKVTNQTPSVMVGSVGQPMIVGGWAKYSIQGSSPTKYAYLGQYFLTNAYLLDTNGVATTNSAGILSPYGEFFPTAPGAATLVTMPDIDPPYQQATCVVQIVKMQLDANHDGNMDLSFNGPDTTSPSQPYVFWCNNNFDRWHTVDGADSEQDDLLQGEDGGTLNLDPNDPDYDYKDLDGNRIIPCKRDLEDFARLWVCGVTSNLLATLPSGSTVTLSWGDMGNPNSSNPTIDLFAAADADGGIGYLTNSTIAYRQIDPMQNPYIHRLGPGDSIQLNNPYLPILLAGGHFIWCGVTNGSGALTLTFADGNGNILGKSSVYIQIKDIKQMYERWTVGDNPNRAPTNTPSLVWNDLPVGMTQPFQYSAPWNNATPYILFVHGWNLPMWAKDRFAETAFKRLYWQGYQGRFGLFRWPTLYAFPLGEMSLQAVNPDNFDTSEMQSWQSGAGLRKLLVQLNNQYPGQVRLMAHSHGNIAAGEALRTNVTLVQTYVAMQAAVPSHAYDPSRPFRTLDATGVNLDSGTIERTAMYWTNGAPCYFYSSAGAAHFANFYSFNDWALGWWLIDQDKKPDFGYNWYPVTNGVEAYYYSTSPYSSRAALFSTGHL